MYYYYSGIQLIKLAKESAPAWQTWQACPLESGPDTEGL